MIDTIQEIGGLVVTLSSILGIFTGIVNKTFTKKLKPIEDKIEKYRLANLRADMEEWRYQVVSFASDLHKGIPKTRHEYEAIFVFMDEYEKAVEELGITNNFFTEESRVIRESYRELNNKD